MVNIVYRADISCWELLNLPVLRVCMHAYTLNNFYHPVITLLSRYYHVIISLLSFYNYLYVYLFLVCIRVYRYVRTCLLGTKFTHFSAISSRSWSSSLEKDKMARSLPSISNSNAVMKNIVDNARPTLFYGQLGHINSSMRKHISAAFRWIVCREATGTVSHWWYIPLSPETLALP